MNNVIELPRDAASLARVDSDSLVLLTTEEVAKMLRVDPSTVRRWRTSTPLYGPPFHQMSDRVTKYDLADVRHWLAARRVDPQAA